jgi:hypothetical protein
LYGDSWRPNYTLDASCFSIKQILCIVKRESKGITETRGVSHCGLAIYIKTYLNAKERFIETEIFHRSKIYSSKNPLKETKNPSRYYNCITNLKFQHKPKYHLSKNPHVKIDILPRGQNPLSYYTL